MKITNNLAYSQKNVFQTSKTQTNLVAFSGIPKSTKRARGLLAVGLMSILSGCAKPALESDLRQLFKFKSPALAKMFEKPKNGYDLIDSFELKAKEIGTFTSSSFENGIKIKVKNLYGIDDKTKTFSYTYRDKRKVANDFSVAPTITFNQSTTSTSSSNASSLNVSPGVTFVNSGVYNVFDVTKTYEDVNPIVGNVFVTRGKDGSPNFSSSDINLYGKLIKQTENFAGSQTQVESTTTVNFPSSSSSKK